MILKKPYAFLIKYFKIIHIILLGLMSYLLYRTNVILNFFQEYIKADQLITGKDFTGELFNIWMFSLPFIIIVILLILLAVMYYKKKPIVFYILNIALMIGVLIVYNIGFDTANTLETQIMEARSLRLIRDVFLFIIIFQGIGLIFTFIRATGFDIKKFDFGQDLEELDITEADNEEFEVDVDIETNVLQRELNRRFRFTKYVYVENKFLINVLVLIIFSSICFTIYMNLTIYNKKYSESESFLATNFTISVNSTYLTNQDYSGNEITDNYLVVVELNIKTNSSKEIEFNTTRAELKVGNHTFYHKNKYRNSLVDLGHVYDDSIISQTSFQKELLVYEIPKSLIHERMTFAYIDTIEANKKGLNPKYISVKINPYNLDRKNKESKVKLNEINSLNEIILKKTNIYLTNFEISEKFRLDYKYCYETDCHDSFEYILPSLNTNYPKALLKIEGISNMDKELGNKEIYDLYTIIHYFGKIKYEIDGQTKYYINLKQIVPAKFDAKNVYYIEMPKEIMDADKINLIFDVRDKVYEYSIK